MTAAGVVHDGLQLMRMIRKPLRRRAVEGIEWRHPLRERRVRVIVIWTRGRSVRRWRLRREWRSGHAGLRASYICFTVQSWRNVDVWVACAVVDVSGCVAWRASWRLRNEREDRTAGVTCAVASLNYLHQVMKHSLPIERP